MTVSNTRFSLLFRLDWEDPEVPMLYLGTAEDRRGMDLPQSGQHAFCPRQPGPGSRVPPAGGQAVRVPEEIYSSLGTAAAEA